MNINKYLVEDFKQILDKFEFKMSGVIGKKSRICVDRVLANALWKIKDAVEHYEKTNSI